MDQKCCNQCGDWTKQTAVDTYDWGKGAVSWGACKTCSSTISSFLNLSGATVSLNLLIYSMLSIEPDKEKRKHKIDDAIDEAMNHLPNTINGVDIDKQIREKTKAMFITNLDKNSQNSLKCVEVGSNT